MTSRERTVLMRFRNLIHGAPGLQNADRAAGILKDVDALLNEGVELQNRILRKPQPYYDHLAKKVTEGLRW